MFMFSIISNIRESTFFILYEKVIFARKLKKIKKNNPDSFENYFFFKRRKKNYDSFW